MISSSEVTKPWTGIGSPQSASYAKSKKPFMPRLVRSKTPDHVIGYGSTFQGRFEFAGLLRVEGRFEGVLKPVQGASVTVARSGVVVGDIECCHAVVVEGTVVGNVSAAAVDLRRHAHVEGNVWCKDLAAASTAVFRNRAAVTQAPSTSAPASRRRSYSASSCPNDTSDAHAKKPITTVNGAEEMGGPSEDDGAGATPPSSGPPSASSMDRGSVAGKSPETVAGETETGSAASAATAGPPLPPPQTPDAVAIVLGPTFSAATSGNAPPAVLDGDHGGACPVAHRDMTSVGAEGSAASTSPSCCTPSLPLSLSNSSSSGRGHVPSVPAHRSCGEGCVSNATRSERPCRPILPPPAAAATEEVSMPSPTRCRHLTAPDVAAQRTGIGCSGGGGGDGIADGVAAGEDVSGLQMVVSATPSATMMPWLGPEPAVSACPYPHDLDAVPGLTASYGGGDAPSQGSQEQAWRNSFKASGFKSPALTKAFSSVAMLLHFDGELGFEEHLQMEYAAENLWFWKRGMRYRWTKFRSWLHREEEARRIYDAFLAVDAPDQVNISHEDREDVLAALEKRPGAQAIGSGLFDAALVQVENMLALGPYPRFAGNTIKNIDKSWAMVVETFSLEDAGESFYSVLFEMAPHVEGLFTRSKRVQGEMLMSIVDASVKLLRNLQELVPVLIQLGLKHNAYKVRAEHFPLVGEALLATLGLALGKEFTAEMRQSWMAVYGVMSNIMISVLEPPPEEEAVGSTVEASSVSSDFSVESGAALVAIGSRASAMNRSTEDSDRRRATSAASAVGHTGGGNAGGGRRRGGGGSGSGGGGSSSSANSGGITASAKVMYRRGTSSIRSRISSFVRRESANANAIHQQQQQQQQQRKHGSAGNAAGASDPHPALSSTATSATDYASDALGAATSGPSSFTGVFEQPRGRRARAAPDRGR